MLKPDLSVRRTLWCHVKALKRVWVCVPSVIRAVARWCLWILACALIEIGGMFLLMSKPGSLYRMVVVAHLKQSFPKILIKIPVTLDVKEVWLHWFLQMLMQAFIFGVHISLVVKMILRHPSDFCFASAAWTVTGKVVRSWVTQQQQAACWPSCGGIFLVLKWHCISSTVDNIVIIYYTTVDGQIPNNHLGCIKPCKQWDIYHLNWCRILSINSSMCLSFSLPFS